MDSKNATYRFVDGSTYVKNPPYFDGITMEPAPVSNITGARILAELGDSITTDHISPARVDPQNLTGRRIPAGAAGRPGRLQQLRARRGNHEVMMRGTFANIRIRNEMLTTSKAA